MEKKVISLREAVEILGEQGYVIKWGENCDLDGFFSYYDAHYKPLLEKESEVWAKRGDAWRFFADDILEIFG